MRSSSPLCPPFICIWLSVPPAPGLRKPGQTKAAPGGEGCKETPSTSSAGWEGPPPSREPQTCEGPAFPGQRAPAVINVAVTAPLLGIFLSADGNTVLGKARASLQALIAYFLKQFT